VRRRSGAEFVSMLSSLSALISLQSIDTAIQGAHRRLSELPAAEQLLSARVDAAAVDVESAKGRLHDNQAARRALEKDVAAVDVRLSRFEDHKAAVRTNQEFTALLHEIATAKAEKDSLEERILVLMEEADACTRELKATEASLASAKREAATDSAALAGEAKALTAEIERLARERTERARDVEARSLALYEQLLKGRRGVAVAAMTGEICAACHVRLRPHIAQVVRRNDEIVQCESCQRILYFQPPAAAQTPVAAS
jgi:predicted  nucleic acid-binding Zn-ribbon protein